MNVSDLQMVLGLSYSTNSSTLTENKDIDYNQHGKQNNRLLNSFSQMYLQPCSHLNVFLGARPRMNRRHSMENLELMKLTPDKINVVILKYFFSNLFPSLFISQTLDTGVYINVTSDAFNVLRNS